MRIAMKRIALIAAAVVLTACGGAKEEPAAEPAMEAAPAPAVDSAAAAPADSAAAPADSTAK